MPLIQWIMQNLSVKKEYGVLAGGESEKRFIYDNLSAGGAVLNGEALEKLIELRFGALVGGDALISKISYLIGSGGVELNGSANVNLFRRFKVVINNDIGDFVYDSCNNAGIVVGFSFRTYSETEYAINRSSKKIILPQSKISDAVNLFDPLLIDNKINQLEFYLNNLENYAVYDGLDVFSDNLEKSYFCDANLIKSKIQNIRSKSYLFNVRKNAKKRFEDESLFNFDLSFYKDRIQKSKTLYENPLKYSVFSGKKVHADSIDACDSKAYVIQRNLNKLSEHLISSQNSNSNKIKLNAAEFECPSVSATNIEDEISKLAKPIRNYVVNPGLHKIS